MALGLGLKLGLGAGRLVGAAIKWILSLLTNDDTTVTNATALVFLNDTNLYGDELITNGDFVTDSGWSLVSATISGGALHLGTASQANQAFAFENGGTYIVVHDSELGSENIILYGDGFFGLQVAEAGLHTYIVTVTTSGGSATNTFRISGVNRDVYSTSVRKVNSLTLIDLPDDVPILNGAQWNSSTEAYSFTLSDGTKVAKTTIESTSNGLVEVLDPLAMVDRVNDESILDGDIRRVMTTEGLNVWVIYNGNGTADSSLPTTSITDIGGAAITDNDTEYLVQSLQTAEGLFSSLAVTQQLLNSDAPATQTTGSLATGDYILWQDGAGSSDLTAGTATIDGTGSATDGSPFTFEVTGAGTVTVTIAGGPPDRFQLEGGSVRTPFIISPGSIFTRSSTVTSTPIAETKLKAAESFILITGNPDRSGQTGALASTYTNADNSTDILINTTDITLRKRITTTDNDAVVSYTHAADTPFAVIAIWDGTNMRITAIAVGGTFPAYETDANTASAILGSTLESCSRNGGEQFQGEGLNVMSFKSEATLIAFVDSNNLADTSNL